MREPLSRRRRKIAILGGAIAVLAGSLTFIRHPDNSSMPYTIAGVMAGIMVGLFLLMVFRRRATR